MCKEALTHIPSDTKSAQVGLSSILELYNDVAEVSLSSDNHVA
jgi:hypothetical protein